MKDVRPPLMITGHLHRYLCLSGLSSDSKVRTCSFFLVREALSQLSYIGVDRTGIEPAISGLQNQRHPIATSGPYMAALFMTVGI